MMGTDYGQRLGRLCEAMDAASVDFCFVGPSSDLLYLTGLDLHPSERLSLLVARRDGDFNLVMASFEAAGLAGLPPGLRVVPWSESEDPAGRVAAVVSPDSAGAAPVKIAVSDRLWSIFLLRLQAALPDARFVPAEGVLAPLRIVKDEYEIGALAEAGARADDAFDEIRGLRFAGQTERQVSDAMAELLRRRGLANEGGPIVASGPNGASPHHGAGDRVIQAGDLVVLDYGGHLNGYLADMTRTVAVGQAPTGEMRAVYDHVRAAQEAGVKAARPGMTGEALDAVVREQLNGTGYGEFFIHRLGHGIGLDGHEAPYLVQGSQTVLAPGMAFSIEPGLYLPGRFGVRIEDIVVLTETGARRLNNATHELVVVE